MSNNKPKWKLSLGGVTASIFVNRTEKGSFKTVALERRYKDGETWKSSNSYTAEQLAQAIAVMQRALGFLVDARENDER